MPIGLMAYIPDDAVFRCVKNIVQCHSQFNDTKTGCQMSGIDRQFLHDVLAKFLT